MGPINASFCCHFAAVWLPVRVPSATIHGENIRAIRKAAERATDMAADTR